MTKQDPNSEKLRVYEYAKSLNMSSKEIITILKRLNISVNNHMSVMEGDTVSRVEQFFRDIKANAAAKRVASEAALKAANQATAQAAQAASNMASAQKPAQTVSASSGSAAFTQSRPTTQQPTHSSNAGNSGNRPYPNRQSGSTASRPYSNQGSQGSSQSSNQGQGSQQSHSPQQSQNPNRYSQTPRDPQQSASSGSSQSQNRRPTDASARPYDSNAPRRPADSNAARRPADPNAPRRPADANASRRPVDAGAPRRPADTAAPRRPADAAAPRRPFENATNQQRGPQSAARPNAGKPFSPETNEFGKSKAAKARSTNGRFDDSKPGSSKNGSSKPYNKNSKGRHQQPAEKKEKVDNTPKKIIVRGTMTVGELAKLLHKDATEVIKKLLLMGVMANINQELDMETIQLIATEFHVDVEIKIAVQEDNFETVEEQDIDEDLLERAPVVTIMGHVDHGKTTLLDAIRHTNVTGGEAGGITQHIGAYQVEIKNKKITFLDTPGHEAFTTMRARGAQVTDITILVVAADDGVMPQTVEAIAHAKAARVPIIVAVNKIDKPEAKPDQIKQELTKYELVPEEWGGDTIFVNISAKQRTGLDELLEMILLVAEVQEFKANPNKRARGTVIEAELDKGRGPVARVLIQHGTLKIGDAFIAGVCFGRVRAMVNDKGRRLKEAGPSTPIELTGLSEVPQAGDPFIVFEDERKARAIADRRAMTLRQSEIGSNTRVTLDDLYKQIIEGEVKELNVIIKADVQGSAEALKGSLEKIEIEGVRVKILHSGVGTITESDIILASASNAIIIGFNVIPESAANATAEQEKVDIRLHRIIYNAIAEIEFAMKGLLDPIYKETIIGHAEVRNLFKISKVGTIAGCMITQGKISRNAEIRLLRGGKVIHQGKIDSLKRFKDDVKEASQGYECGITLEKFNELAEGDIIEAFIMEVVER